MQAMRLVGVVGQDVGNAKGRTIVRVTIAGDAQLPVAGGSAGRPVDMTCVSVLSWTALSSSMRSRDALEFHGGHCGITSLGQRGFLRLWRALQPGASARGAARACSGARHGGACDRPRDRRRCGRASSGLPGQSERCLPAVVADVSGFLAHRHLRAHRPSPFGLFSHTFGRPGDPLLYAIHAIAEISGVLGHRFTGSVIAPAELVLSKADPPRRPVR